MLMYVDELSMEWEMLQFYILFPTNIPKYLLCLIYLFFSWVWQNGGRKAKAVVELKWSPSLGPLDWEPQTDLPRPRKSTSGPRRRDRRPVSGSVRAGFSSAPPGQPPIVLREPQHGGISAVGDPGWGRVGGAGHAGLVSQWGRIFPHPQPKTPPDFSRLRLHLSRDL